DDEGVLVGRLVVEGAEGRGTRLEVDRGALRIGEVAVQGDPADRGQVQRVRCARRKRLGTSRRARRRDHVFEAFRVFAFEMRGVPARERARREARIRLAEARLLLPELPLLEAVAE